MTAYDIRRTIRSDNAYTGEQLARTMYTAATMLGKRYIQKESYNLDGNDTYEIGLAGRRPEEDIILRVDDNLNTTTITTTRAYTIFGIGSHIWTMANNNRTPRTNPKHNTDLYIRKYTSYIEDVRDTIEQLLTTNTQEPPTITTTTMLDHYEALYQHNKHYWGTTPSPVALLLLAHKKTGTILDLGCGQGPDTIFFATKGFIITALDISPTAINDLKEYATTHDLKSITAIVADMNDLPQQHYDIIFSRMALQMITPAHRSTYIEKLKTAYPALHAHIIPIQGACFGDNFICDNNLLQEAYKDWNILYYEETMTIARAPNNNGEPYLMKEARIIAAPKYYQNTTTP